MTARRWWWRNGNVVHIGMTEGDNAMGQEWVGRPEVAESKQSVEQRIDLALSEGARAARILAEDERLYRVALTEFEQRVKALPELGGPTASEQQFLELGTIETLLVTLRGRASILRARRRDGIGLYRQTTGEPLPPVRYAVESCANDWHQSAPHRANLACPECPIVSDGDRPRISHREIRGSEFPVTVEARCRECQQPKPYGELEVGAGICAECDIAHLTTEDPK